jgi:acetolactate synthase-1/3 small subunit
MKSNYVLTIFSEDRKGLISIITSMLNRKGIEMESINAARTDIHTRVIITIQLNGNADEIKLMTLKINNIIEVYHAEVRLLSDISYQKVAFYAINKDSYNVDLFNKMQKYGATIVGDSAGKIIIQKIGREEDIQSLYNELEGKDLRSFSKSALISFNAIELSEEPVISMAA